MNDGFRFIKRRLSVIRLQVEPSSKSIRGKVPWDKANKNSGYKASKGVHFETKMRDFLMFLPS